MKNSKYVDCEVLSPNHSGARGHSVDRITPHCVVGQLSAEGIGYCFPAGREASCNYGIGADGRVCLIVDEKNRSWCSSSADNDDRAITIECASDTAHPYAMTDAVYKKLVLLCEDICRRYGKKRLIWMPDAWTALRYQPQDDEMILTVHRWFAEKACPGDWLFSRLGGLADEVTKKLNGGLTMEQYNELKKSLSGISARLEKLENKMVYNYVDKNMPEWARPTIQKMVDKKILVGDEQGALGLTDEMLRTYVVMDRAGIFGE